MIKNLKNHIAVALVVGTLTVGGSLSIYAASTDAELTKPNISTDQNFRNGRGSKIMDFSNLVTTGVIDQATADKMAEYMTSKNADHQAEREKVKAMTEEERKVYFEENKNTQKSDHMAEMVTNGILTQEQLDTIKATMPIRENAIGKDANGRGHKMMNTANLVTTGVIDQATADKMTEYMTSKNADRQAEMEKVKAMTQEERKAYFEENKNTQRPDHITEMVTNGILTQEQADAIKATMPVRENAKDGSGRGNKNVNTDI